MSSIDGRIKPKRREQHPVRRNPKGMCVGCENYEKYEGDVCLWKLEAQIDKANQHINIAVSKGDLEQTKKAAINLRNALCLIRKITARQRQLYRKVLAEDVVREPLSSEVKQP